MKILQITTSTTGGAGIACLRLHRQFRQAGISSRVFCLKDRGRAAETDADIIPLINSKKISFWPNRFMYKIWQMRLERHLKGRPPGFEVFSSSESTFDITKDPAYQEADLVHLHWTAGFLDHRDFFQKNTKPVVFTLHDMFPFTGGCHHADGCMKFTATCDHCPQLAGTIDDSYAAAQLAIKINGISPAKKIHIATPSTWLLDLSKQSRLFYSFPHSHVPNGTNEAIFNVMDRAAARQQLGLPDDRPVLLFVAETIDNHRKGFHLLLGALAQLETQVTLVAMGANANPALLPPGAITLGRIDDEKKMALCYNAADGFVLPSLAENLPNTIVEALLCGTPVAAFSVGGITEMIQSAKNGFLSKEVSVDGLLQVIRQLIQGNTVPRDVIRRDAAEKYAIGKAAASYIRIYHGLTEAINT
jgi:glycosyltransferase involved in cell wall biosynthesis